MAIVKNKGGLMSVVMQAAGVGTAPKTLEAPQAIWQCKGGWIESLQKVSLDYVRAYINYVMGCLLESRKVQAMLFACPRDGLGVDIQLHLYIADTDQEVYPQPVILCHRGGGLFWIYGEDSDRIKAVLDILSQVGWGK